MEKEYAPINHGTLSGVGTTAAEASKGGMGGLWKGFLVGGLGTFVASVAVLGFVGLAIGFWAAGIGGLLTGLAIGSSFGAVAGIAGSVFAAPILAPLGAGLGTIYGTVKGASRGVDRVSGERGASEMLSAQVQVAKAQAQGANTNIYIPQASNDNKYGFPMQGAAMNPAMGSVQLDGAQYAGTAAGQQRAVGM